MRQNVSQLSLRRNQPHIEDQSLRNEVGLAEEIRTPIRGAFRSFANATLDKVEGNPPRSGQTKDVGYRHLQTSHLARRSQARDRDGEVLVTGRAGLLENSLGEPLRVSSVQ